MAGLRVLVCGGRNFEDRGKVFEALDHLHAKRGIGWVIHGAAPGADTLASEWARANKVQEEPYHALWHRHGAAAGPMRNEQMLRDGRPDAVVAFPGGRGTMDMCGRAEAAGLKVWRPFG